MSGQSGRGPALVEDEASQFAGDAFLRPTAASPVTERNSRQFSDFDKKSLFDDKPDAYLGRGFGDEDEPFLRSRQRVAVRRGFWPKGWLGRTGFGLGALAAVAGLLWLSVTARNFAARDPRFRIESSENIQILGNSQVTQAELLSVFGRDMGRNVFFVPLADRRAELERLPWVERATVMRLLPNQLRVAVVERTPVAFARTGSQVELVDSEGTLLPATAAMLATKHYSFPVLTGIEPGDAASTRLARMRIYRRFVAELDSDGTKISPLLSEVDVSDPEDVKAMVPDASSTGSGTELLLHFGERDFLSRWRNYEQHLAEWKRQYPQLGAVDLRYERQVVLEMKSGAGTSQATGRTEGAEDGSGDVEQGASAGASPVTANLKRATGKTSKGRSKVWAAHSRSTGNVNAESSVSRIPAGRF